MIEAERMGYNIPSGFRQKWISYQKKLAQDWRFDQRYEYYATEQAYRLFTLALAGQPDKGAMNRLREASNMPALARWLLAASFATTGRPEAAGELLDVRNIVTEPKYYYYHYGSQLRDKSIILYTLTLTKNLDQALPLFNEICESLNKDTWYSTQSIAWGLFAYMKWVGALPVDKNNPVEVKIDFNGEKTRQTIGGKLVWKKELEMKSGNNKISVENASSNPAYVNLVRKGIPLKSDADKSRERTQHESRLRESRQQSHRPKGASSGNRFPDDRESIEHIDDRTDEHCPQSNGPFRLGDTEYQAVRSQLRS